MAKPFSELTKNFSPECKARIAEGSKKLLVEYNRMVKASETEEPTQSAPPRDMNARIWEGEVKIAEDFDELPPGFPEK